MKETLYESINEWFDVYIKYKVAETTYRSYEFTIKRIKKYQRDIALRDFSFIHIQKLLNLLCQEGYSRSSIHKVRVMLNQVMSLAQKIGYIDRNPVALTSLPNAPQKLVEALTSQEQKIVELICKDVYLGEVFIFLLYTGLRVDELSNLKWKNYYPEQKEIRVKKSKTAKGIRTIPLVKKSAAIIEKQKRVNEYIFAQVEGHHWHKLSLIDYHET